MPVGSRFSPPVPTGVPEPLSRLGEILTLAEVAEYLRIPKKTAYKMVRSGDLTAFKAGKHWRVLRAELGAWIARRSVGGGRQAK